MKRVPHVALVLLANLLFAVGASPAQIADGRSSDRLFHKPGLVYFWALNDECSDAKIDRSIDAFAQGGASAVCLHPRAGLLKPYGGDAWFEFVRRTVDRCAERGLDVWLYDEDPYPSGNAGGRMTMEHPEFQAMEINRFEPTPAAETKGLYCFPVGHAAVVRAGERNDAGHDGSDQPRRAGAPQVDQARSVGQPLLLPRHAAVLVPARVDDRAGVRRRSRARSRRASSCWRLSPSRSPSDAWPIEPDRLESGGNAASFCS